MVSLPRIDDLDSLRSKCGSYVRARQAVRRRTQDADTLRIRKVEDEIRRRQKAKELQHAIKLSTTTGQPSLANPIAAQHVFRKKPPPPKGLPPVKFFSDDDRRKRDARLKRFEDVKRTKRIKEDLHREQRIHSIFFDASSGTGKITRDQFSDALHKIFGESPSEDKEEIWWRESVKGSRSTEAIDVGNVQRPVEVIAVAILKDAADAESERERKERKAMKFEEDLFRASAEILAMAEEDFRCNKALKDRLFGKRPYRPFATEKRRELLPAPPPWREGGATGNPCAATKFSITEYQRVLSTHVLSVNGTDDAHLPTIPVGSTFFLQLGLTELRLSRNKNMKTLTWPGTNPALTCRALTLFTKIIFSRSGLEKLPFDFGLLRHLTVLDLSYNYLSGLPRSFAKLKLLTSVNLTCNAFKELPDDMDTWAKNLKVLKVAENMISRLPSTLPRLPLEILDLTANALISLAVLPLLQEVAGTRVFGAEEWEPRRNPTTRKHYYVHIETKKISQIRPALLQSLDKKIKAAAKPLPEDLADAWRRTLPPKAGTEAHHVLRKHNAHRGIHEWSVNWSEAENRTLHSNSSTSETVTTIPPALDTIGRLKQLRELKLDRQRLRDLPPSVTLLENLTKLSARQNYIRKLPENFGEGPLQRKLKFLNLGENELSELPPSFVNFGKTLTDLSLMSNRFEKLPDFIGHMKSIRKLFLGHNYLTTLPYEIGFADSLVELQVYDNPLDEVWYESINDLPKLKWHCRQKYWSLRNGPLPDVEYRAVGTNDEVLEPEPAYKQRIAGLLEKHDGKLILQLQGIHEIPGAECDLKTKQARKKGKKCSDDDFGWSHPKLENCHTLKMIEDHFQTAPFFTKSMRFLRILWLKACKIQRINDDLERLQSLTELNLENNVLYDLPTSFSRLRKLQKVNLAKNRLQTLPMDLGNLRDVKELDVSMNRLETLPESLKELTNLIDFAAAKNFLYKLPPLFLLRNLQRLNLDANELHCLPPKLGDLPLVTLRASHNRLERLDDDTFGPGTTKHLEYLGLSKNNLLELNSCLPTCTKLTTLQVEFNPLRSPPPDLLSQGLDVLQRYCDLRDTRISDLQKLLTDYGYEYDPGHLTPEAYRVLTGRTGFLTEDDLEAFDKAVDAYLNGPYYTNTATDTEIVERLDGLKHEREHVFYNAVLKQLIETLKDELASRDRQKNDHRSSSSSQEQQPGRFGPGVLLEEKRPWGRKGEMIGCYAISLDALVRDTPAGQYLKEKRPALFTIMKAKLPPSPFGYTLEILKDAITKYEGPYGPVAQLDKVQFERCECVDSRGRSKGHKPCVLPSVVVAKTIYTVGEAQRRSTEDDTIRAAWSKIWETMTKQLETRLGKLMANQEMFRRQRDQGKIAKQVKAAVADKQKHVKRAVEYLQAAKNRKESFEDGGAYVFHRLDSTDEAQRLVSGAEKELEERRAAVRDAEKKFAVVKNLTSIPKKMQLQKIALDLKQKYCVLEYEKIIDDGRRKAFDNAWRRPWDGPEGCFYKEWCNRNGAALSAGRFDVMTLPRWAARLAPRVGSNNDDENDQVTFDYNWVGTDNMDLFSNERYMDFEDEYIGDIVSKLQGGSAAKDAKAARRQATTE